MPKARNQGGAVDVDGTGAPASSPAPAPVASASAKTRPPGPTQEEGDDVGVDPTSTLMATFPLTFAPIAPIPEPSPGGAAGDAPAAPVAAVAAAGLPDRPDFPPPAAPVETAVGGATATANTFDRKEQQEEEEEGGESKVNVPPLPTHHSPGATPPAHVPKRRGRPPGSKNKKPRKTPVRQPRKPPLDKDGFTPVHRDPDPQEADGDKTLAKKGKAGGAEGEAAGDGEEPGSANKTDYGKKPPKRTKHKQLINSEGRCRRCLEGPKFKKGHARTCPKSVHYGAPIPPDSSSDESDEWETDSEAEESDSAAGDGEGVADEGAGGEDDEGVADAIKSSSPRRTTPRRAAAVAAVRRDLDRELERRLKQKQRLRRKEVAEEDADDENRDDDDLMKEIETLARPSGVEGLEEALGGGNKSKRGMSPSHPKSVDDGGRVRDESPPKGKRRKKKKKKRRKKRGSSGEEVGEEPRHLSPLEEYKLAEKQREEAVQAAEWAKKEMEEAIARYEAARDRIRQLDDQMKAKENAVVDTRLGDESEWSRMYAKLQAYKDVHGQILFPLNCYKSEDSDPELRELFQWVMKQRKTARHMAAWRKKALDRIGLNYDTHDATWEARYMELAEFRNRHGTCVVPHNHHENPQLGQWVSTQRRMRRNLAEEGKGPKTCVLTEERIVRLDALGFVWDAPSSAWSDRFKELLAYKAEVGNFNVPNPWPANPPLQRWVQTQRTHYRYYKEGNPKCQLTAERIQMLDDVGFPWRQRPDWRSSYDRLVRYKAEYGTSVVSEGYDKSLAKWTRNQRTEYRLMLQGRKNKLKPDHVRLLDEIGFDWIPPTKR